MSDISILRHTSFLIHRHFKPRHANNKKQEYKTGSRQSMVSLGMVMFFFLFLLPLLLLVVRSAMDYSKTRSLKKDNTPSKMESQYQHECYD